MRKAFKSSTIQDQQVVSRSSVPNPVVEMYHRCDKPPPLNILSPYRDDKKEALKFYTDPSYFFNLWKEKMLQATEDKRKEKRRQKSCPAHPDRPLSRQAAPRSPLSIEQQKHSEDPGREVKKVRKARNRRQEWNVLAYDKEFRPDARLTPSPYHGMSSEGSLSPDNRSLASDSYPASPCHPPAQPGPGAPHPADPQLAHTQSLDRGLRPANQPPGAGGAAGGAGRGRHVASLGRLPSGHGAHVGADPTVNGPRQQSIKDYRAGHSQPSTIPEYYIPPAPPPPPPTIPSAQTAFDATASPPPHPPPPPPSSSASVAPPANYCPLPPAPRPPNYVPSPPPSPAAPPLPPPAPLPPSAIAAAAAYGSPGHAHSGEAPPPGRKGTAILGLMPMSDARSDLLAAIRRGIQLRKVQEQREQEAKREPVGNDVATILSRRIAVEYSESDDDSELDDNDWSD
ncbi:unnamed protein product [Gadus morhua 'NCC']